jgi:hypothetical protein
MKSTFFISIFLSCWQLHAQSKKEQIELLTFKIDSLNLEIIKFKSELTNKSQKLNELGISFDSISKKNTDLSISIKKINEEIYINTLNTNRLNSINLIQEKKIDSLILITQKRNYYTDVLPKGFSITDSNNELGQNCKSDIDQDGIEDLIILLFDEENMGQVSIFLSSNFYKDNSFQTFSWPWIGNNLGSFSCINNEFFISGGSANQYLFIDQEAKLKYSNLEKKMIVTSFKQSDESDKAIDIPFTELNLTTQKN